MPRGKRRDTPMLGNLDDKPKSWIGADRDKLEIIGDIITPTDIVWEAEQGLIDGEDCSY